MATSKKSSGGRSGGPSKAAASKGGRASGGGATKKSAGASKKSAGGARGTASKATAPKKAAATKSSGGARAGSARGAAGSKATASKAAATRGGSSRGTATKATASRSTAGARGGAASRSGATARGGSSARSGAAASSRGRSGASSSRSRGAQQSADPRNDLEKLLVDGLKDIYYAEKKLVPALKKMGKKASNAQLADAFATHQMQTEEQVRRLDEAFASVGLKPAGKKCAAMDGLLEEGNEHIEEYSKGPGLDAAMIVGAQKVEHYEIAAYGSLRTFANTLGHTQAARIFEEILQQESDTDELLTGIAQTVNREATGSHEEEEGGQAKGTSAGGGSGDDESGGNDRDADNAERDLVRAASATADADMDDASGDNSNGGDE